MTNSAVVMAAFEEFAPRALEVAWDYVDRSDEVEAMTLAFLQEDGLSVCIPTYRVKGQRREIHQLSDLGVDCSQQAQSSMLDEMNFLSLEFVEAVETESDVPSMILVDYVVATQEMDAEFFDDDLQPGVDADGGKPLASLANEWVNRYVATGNRSFMTYHPDSWQQWRSDSTPSS